MEFTGRSKAKIDINMAPLVDVVFLLLIFFLLTSTLIVQEGIEVDLPGSSTSETTEEAPIVVTITKGGKHFLNDKEIQFTDLKKALSLLFKHAPEELIILKSDASVPVQSLIDTMDAIKSSGGTNISLATKGK